MSQVTVRRRPHDGLTEVVPNTSPLARADRYALMFSVLLTAKVLYLSTLVPAQLFAIVIGCCLSAELAIFLRDAGLMQPPKAPVLVLRESRWSGLGRPE